MAANVKDLYNSKKEEQSYEKFDRFGVLSMLLKKKHRTMWPSG